MSAVHRERARRLSRRSPWDFTIQYPPRREYFMEHFRAPREEAGAAHELGSLPALLLYLHVPFCAQRCSYCNFAVDLGRSGERMGRYVTTLLGQLRGLHDQGLRPGQVRGIDVGGGTPTLLPLGALERLLVGLEPYVEEAGLDPLFLSVESTPEIAADEPEKLALLARHGARRLSIGVQSTHDPQLDSLGRPALSQEQLGRAVGQAREVGLERINLDLIFGLPGQGRQEWEADLQRVIRLRPDSVTTYDCLYRGKGRSLTRRTAQLPTPEQLGVLYDLGWLRLRDAGYHAPYGSVNFSLRPQETGTSAYFEGRLLDGLPYLGLGNYATSLLDQRWTWAERGLARWMDRAATSSAIADDYLLPDDEVIAKQALLMLSFGGLRGERFERRFGTPLEQHYGDALALAEDQQLLERRGEDWWMVPGSFGRLPLLRALLYSERALAWLEDLAALSAGRAGPGSARSPAPSRDRARP